MRTQSGPVPNFTWSTQQRIAPAITTSKPPALVAYQGYLYAFHENYGDQGRLQYTRRLLSDPTAPWSANANVGGNDAFVGTTGTPAAIVLKDARGERIYVFHEGAGLDGWLHLSIFDGRIWVQDSLPKQPGGGAIGTSRRPGLIVVGNTLYIVHWGQGEGHLWLATYDPAKGKFGSDNDSGYQVYGAPSVVATPSQGFLAVTPSQAEYGPRLWSWIYDIPTTSWGRLSNFPTMISATAPALAEISDRTYFFYDKFEIVPTGNMVCYIGDLANLTFSGAFYTPVRTRGTPGMHYDKERRLLTCITENPDDLGYLTQTTATVDV